MLRVILMGCQVVGVCTVVDRVAGPVYGQVHAVGKHKVGRQAEAPDRAADIKTGLLLFIQNLSRLRMVQPVECVRMVCTLLCLSLVVQEGHLAA